MAPGDTTVDTGGDFPKSAILPTLVTSKAWGKAGAPPSYVHEQMVNREFATSVTVGSAPGWRWRPAIIGGPCAR